MVDFAALQESNPDVVAWVRIPGVLEYPVVRGGDKSCYLSHAAQNTYNIASSILGIIGMNGIFQIVRILSLGIT